MRALHLRRGRSAENRITDLYHPQAIQCLISLRRLEKYLRTPEVDAIPALTAPETQQTPAFNSATVTWPRKNESDDKSSTSGAPSGASTPAARGFELQDIDVTFPEGKMSLICGSLGSGKTLMLLGEHFS